MNRGLLSLLILISFGAGLLGQEKQQAAEKAPSEPQSRHMVAVGFGFSFIPVAGDMGTSDASGLFAPVLGLDYIFQLTRRWEIGIMLNYELDHYVIVDSQVERENAFLAALIGSFNITRYWGVFTGGGIEIESHDNLAVFRLGTDYTIQLKKNWQVIPSFYFDFKENYDTWSLQLSIGKKF